MTAFDFMLGTAGSEVLMSACDASLDLSIEDIAFEDRLAGGKLIRYNVAKIRHWKISYSWLPGKKRDVWDGGMGRDDLFTLYTAGASMSFLMPQDQGVQLSYTVKFALNSWQEALIFRRGDFWAWRVSFELVQVS